MDLPFTTEQFVDVFVRYNLGVSPAQWLLYSLAGFVLVLLITRTRRSNALAVAILSLFWFWSGSVYHVLFFAPVNPVGFLFGALFIAEGALLLWSSLRSSDLVPGADFDWLSAVGGFLIWSALFIYPALNVALNHEYPAMPTLGAPCPTTLFTIGVLLWMKPRVPIRVFIIPVSWSVIALAAAVRLGMYEDYLLLAGIVGGGFVMLAKLRGKVAAEMNEFKAISRAPL